MALSWWRKKAASECRRSKPTRRHKESTVMKLIHSDPAAFIDSRLERLAAGRRRRHLQRREASGNNPQGTTPRGTSPKKAA
jgi:hypothetical protein